jgi:hypothetical protein
VAERLRIASSDDFEEADAEQGQQPDQQRMLVARDDPVVDRVLDDQRRRDCARLPQQAGKDRADDPAGL